MEKFIDNRQMLVVPLDRANVDTDAIIPKQFLKSVQRLGYGPHLFDEWRYMDHGEFGMDPMSRQINTAFVLNQPRYQKGEILLAKENFGCGSSREHAVWALSQYGFRVILAPSFGDIFFANALKNGLLVIQLAKDTINDLFSMCETTPNFSVQVNLAEENLVTSTGHTVPFTIRDSAKKRLIQGLDDIALTLQQTSRILDYEARRKELEPWLFANQ
jgi:3-isopropylmalate/(R)-2-methylmalate dehydratase small subunit